MYLLLYEGQTKMLVKNTTMPFLKRETCSQRKNRFYLVKVQHFQNFLILCHLKPSYRQDWLQVGNWIQTPFSIFMEHYLAKFCNKFDSTLLDSTRSSQFGRKGKSVNDGCFLFTIGFKSLYTLSKIKEVSYSEINNLYSKNHPDSDHFFNIV